MARGQGSMEYLIILIAVVAFVTIVGAVLLSFFAPTDTQKVIEVEKAVCAAGDATLMGYTQQYTGSEPFPFAIEFRGRPFTHTKDSVACFSPPESGFTLACTLGTKPFNLTFYRNPANVSEMAYFLEKEEGDCRLYYPEGSAAVLSIGNVAAQF